MTDVNGRFDDLMRTEFPAGIEPADTELPLVEPDPEWFNEPPEDDFAPPPVIAGNPWSMLGKAGAALAMLGDNVIEAADPALAAADLWLALPGKERDVTAIFASGREARTIINDRVQEGLVAEGGVRGDDFPVTVYERINTTREELRHVSTYRAGQTLGPADFAYSTTIVEHALEQPGPVVVPDDDHEEAIGAFLADEDSDALVVGSRVVGDDPDDRPPTQLASELGVGDAERVAPLEDQREAGVAGHRHGSTLGLRGVGHPFGRTDNNPSGHPQAHLAVCGEIAEPVAAAAEAGEQVDPAVEDGVVQRRLARHTGSSAGRGEHEEVAHQGAAAPAGQPVVPQRGEHHGTVTHPERAPHHLSGALRGAGPHRGLRTAATAP